MKRGDTVFLNSAVVPRVESSQDGEELSYFVRTTWSEGECLSMEEVWVDTHGGEHSATPIEAVTIDAAVPALDEADEQ